jgi:hypothetical protein
MKNFFYLTVIASSFLACNMSPILNHATASSPSTTSEALKTLNASNAEECPFDFQEIGLCGKIIWTKVATEDSGGEFFLKFWKKAEQYPENGPYTEPDLSVDILLWMQMGEMGHGTRPKPILSPYINEEGHLVHGVYRATKVFFSMPGKWQLSVLLKKGSEVRYKSMIYVEAQ